MAKSNIKRGNDCASRQLDAHQGRVFFDPLTANRASPSLQVPRFIGNLNHFFPMYDCITGPRSDQFARSFVKNPPIRGLVDLCVAPWGPISTHFDRLMHAQDERNHRRRCRAGLAFSIRPQPSLARDRSLPATPFCVPWPWKYPTPPPHAKVARSRVL